MLLILFFSNTDFSYYTGSFEEKAKPLVLHWINRIQYPVQPILNQLGVEFFLEYEKENIERSAFLEGEKLPIGQIYEDSPTKQRAVLYASSKESLIEFKTLGLKLSHRFDLRLGIIRSNSDILF